MRRTGIGLDAVSLVGQLVEGSSIMLEWTKCGSVERQPGMVSGAWLFRGTRVPATALFENLEDGASIDEFVEWFPGVTREQVLDVLRFAEASLAIAS